MTRIALLSGVWLALIAGALSEQPPAMQRLSETGLYADIASKTILSGNLMYSPQYPLWSDGASKSRWIYLPPGQTIDASDPHHWIFPVGAKFWKEFSFGRRVETRLIEKVAPLEWTFHAYAWNAEGSEAMLVSEYGSRNHVEIAPGIKHDIPTVNDCKTCHVSEGREVILGFNLLQLSPDRDSLAPNAEAFTESMIGLNELVARGLVSNLPEGYTKSPPRIKAKSATERAARGYLWSNCGNCHNPTDPTASVGLILTPQLDYAFETRPDYLQTAVGQASDYEIPGLVDGKTLRIAPGEPSRSSVWYRMQTRNPYEQMPALGTKIADKEAVRVIAEWIRNLDK